MSGQEADEMKIDEFNALDENAARETVAVWAAIPAWVDAIVVARPFASPDALAAHADEWARAWGRDDLDAALAHHPRIGERPTGAGAEAGASSREQASMSSASGTVQADIARANVEYEERFGRVFLIRAAGRSPEEMLTELRRRLTNGPEAEAIEALDQLRQIALLRLRSTVED